ncbi:MAG: hypothetical protein LQ351_006100 [Letrouitia transgressa]|nr:MAG: hypothetical protein LQ351_006100 [Letrouitia transgressa]
MPDFQDLPPEVVIHIIDYLDEEESVTKKEILLEPAIHLVHPDLRPLKAFASTCKALRRLTFYQLFSLVRICFPTLTPQSSSTASAAPCFNHLAGLYHLLDLYDLWHRIKGITIYFTDNTELGEHYLPDFRESLLRPVLGRINPEFLTILAPTQVLANLASLPDRFEDAWLFGRRIQILQLHQAQIRPLTRETPLPQSAVKLVNSVPWDRLTINDNSSISVYSTYEYFLKQTPSILSGHNSTGWRVLANDIKHSLRHLTYVAIFPLVGQMVNFMSLVEAVRGLETLTTQLTPAQDAKTDILADPARVGKASIPDLWMEARSCYQVLGRRISKMHGRDRKLRKWTAIDYHAFPIKAEILEYLTEWEETAAGTFQKRAPELSEG